MPIYLSHYMINIAQYIVWNQFIFKENVQKIHTYSGHFPYWKKSGKNPHIFRIFSGYSNHQKKFGRKIWSFFGSNDRHFPDISRYTQTFSVTISGHSFFIGQLRFYLEFSPNPWVFLWFLLAFPFFLDHIWWSYYHQSIIFLIIIWAMVGVTYKLQKFE